MLTLRCKLEGTRILLQTHVVFYFVFKLLIMIKKERETIISNENTAYIRHSEVCRADGKKIIKLG